MAKTSKTSTSSQADFPARTSQSQEKGQESKKERGLVFGQSCTVSLAKYDPDMHSLRMYQCSLFGEEQELLLILPKSGTIVNGRLSEQTMLVHGIEGKGSGSWPTPQAMDARQDVRMRSELSEKAKKGGCSNLREEVHRRTFPTPRGSEGGIGMCGGQGSRDMLIDLKEDGQITETERKAMQSGNGGQLNPTWVEWLMGFPLGWTDLKDSETQ